eukprot:5261302-Prymnesium_polylepis.1
MPPRRRASASRRRSPLACSSRPERKLWRCCTNREARGVRRAVRVEERTSVFSAGVRRASCASCAGRHIGA